MTVEEIKDRAFALERPYYANWIAVDPDGEVTGFHDEPIFVRPLGGRSKEWVTEGKMYKSLGTVDEIGPSLARTCCWRVP